jgi:nucleoside-diphosphate-sugar epimerase
MHVVVIGGTGHVGAYLIPRLVQAGFEVSVITRGQRQPYVAHGAWQKVRTIQIDRSLEEQAGSFGAQILALQPDIVIDMICFTQESAQQLVEALRAQVQLFLHCSTVWVHGHTCEIPVTEAAPRQPIGEYGKNKAAIEKYLHREYRQNGFPAALILPGHIVGQGWIPLNPQGNFNSTVFSRLATGKEVTLPNLGTEVVHHVHADDVAQLFMQAIEHRTAALGESFHVLSPKALTLRGYAEAVAGWFGQKANLTFLPFLAWRDTVSPQDAEATYGHLEHSPNCYSIAKAQRVLDYHPRYTSLQAIYESVNWLIEHGIINL